MRSFRFVIQAGLAAGDYYSSVCACVVCVVCVWVLLLATTTGLVRCALRQEDLGGSGDRSVLLDQLALEESDWHWVSRALETGGATPSQRSAWIPASVRSTVGSRLDRSALSVGEDVLGEVFDSYPVGAPP